MIEDEEKAKRMAKFVVGQDLSQFSVDEISDMIEALQAEIKRLETAKRDKSNHLSAASALFKS